MSEILSSNWDWVEKEEVFSTNVFNFDVDKAKRIIKRTPRPIITIQVADYAGLIEAIPIEVEAKRVARGDFTVPLILATLRKGGRLLIDGWHRLAQANNEGIERLPAVILTPEETKKVRC